MSYFTDWLGRVALAAFYALIVLKAIHVRVDNGFMILTAITAVLGLVTTGWYRDRLHRQTSEIYAEMVTKRKNAEEGK